MLDVHGWFGFHRSVGLQNPLLHSGSHFGIGVPDVDLPASDVVLATV